MTSITRWVLCHKPIVSITWVAVTLAVIATVGSSTGAFSKKFSVPGRVDGRPPGVPLEAMLGGLGALVLLAFVFASLNAFVPILMAIVSIMTTFLVLWGVAAVTDVSMIVERTSSRRSTAAFR
jgi:RND superfamily putative drug exporter